MNNEQRAEGMPNLQALIEREVEGFQEKLGTYLQGMKDTDVSELEYMLRAKRDTDALYAFLRLALRRVVEESFAGVGVEKKAYERKYQNIPEENDYVNLQRGGFNSAISAQQEKTKKWLG
jgi:hypothetical protein